MGIIFLIRSMIAIFWIFDILNLPFMEIFDTTYPINTVAWLLIWLLIMVDINIIHINEDKSDSES